MHRGLGVGGGRGHDRAGAGLLHQPAHEVLDVDHAAQIVEAFAIERNAGMASLLKHLQQLGIPIRPRNFPESQLYQLFIKDPDGLTIELNFFGVTKAPDWGGEDYSRMPRAASQKNPAKKKAAKSKGAA